MEALACGTPVVAFRRGALSEVVEHGRTGILVDSPSELAQAMLEAGKLSPKVCRERARQNFSATDMIRSYLSLYQELARRTEPPGRVREEAA
jgi:glycosyltransferase involved in cell wall biosynthesis